MLLCGILLLCDILLLTGCLWWHAKLPKLSRFAAPPRRCVCVCSTDHHHGALTLRGHTALECSALVNQILIYPPLPRCFSVTGAYAGFLRMLKDPDIADAFAGILATEAYQAGMLRSILFDKDDTQSILLPYRYRRAAIM